MLKILAWFRIFLMCLVLVFVVGSGLLFNAIFPLSLNAKFRIRTTYCKIAIFLIGIRLVKSGDEARSQRPALYLCNHRSVIDPIITAYFVNAFFLSKAEIESYPVLGKGAALTGTIFVQRSDKGSRSASRQVIIDTLRAGNNVILFPEGTTAGTDYTKDFFLGSFMAAQEANVDIVPCVVEFKNRNDYWVDTGLMAKTVEQLSKWRTDVHFWVGKPFNLGDAKSNMDECKRRIDRKINEVQTAWKNPIEDLP